MDAAIVSPAKILPLVKISDDHQQVCRDLINDNRRFENDICVYDPLTELTQLFEGVSAKEARASGPSLSDLPIDKRLKQHIIDGERIGLDPALDEAMKDYAPLHIINTFLLDGMKVVGELFGSGQMQLPFVLQSAETMKSAVAHLEPYMETVEGESNSKGKFLIATVKGDVHDIGKNLVDIILTNNGYEVVNLGIKQSCDAIVNAQIEHQADCLAMSGLLVKSTAFMKDNLAAFNDSGIDVPVILGGAALTPRFVQKDCREVYNGKVIYGRDAFADLRFMDALMDAKKKDNWSNLTGFLADAPQGVGLDEVSSDESDHPSADTETAQKEEPKNQIPVSTERSIAVAAEPMPVAPFLGSTVLTEADLDLQEVFAYLDRNALFAGQWQFRKTKQQSRDEYEAMLAEKAEPVLKHWIDRCLNESLLAPGAVYGYFPVGRDENALRVFSADQSTELGRFDLPRQRSGNRYCIADFFSDVSADGRPTDVLPMQAVTMGEKASIVAQELFKGDRYSDYLYFHGLAVQMAEALAEWVHARIRQELGFADPAGMPLRDVLAQRYRGSRYSFGYPACPNVADSRQQLLWLDADRIGLTMDASDQLSPEQSTTALVALHSKARYFSA
jgi:5-methyltetrahydrofolate--homocysteine methyltransferase